MKTKGRKRRGPLKQYEFMALNDQSGFVKYTKILLPLETINVDQIIQVEDEFCQFIMVKSLYYFLWSKSLGGGMAILLTTAIAIAVSRATDRGGLLSHGPGPLVEAPGSLAYRGPATSSCVPGGRLCCDIWESKINMELCDR